MKADGVTPTCGVLAGEPEIVGTRCKDGGTCHHECEGTCFRQGSCGPLTLSGLRENWSEPSSSVPTSLATAAAEQPLEIPLCDAPRIGLKPDRLYRFFIEDACRSCAAWAAYSRGEGPQPADNATPAHASELLQGWVRYEKARKLSPRQWAELHARNLAGENFDAMIDALPVPATPQPAG